MAGTGAVEGEVTVDVASIQIGESGKWSSRCDTSSGKVDTVDYPTGYVIGANEPSHAKCGGRGEATY